jgi:hypothetical protein
MTLRSRYDPREDRMLLTLRVGEGDQQYWVTRRLWLALHERLAALVPAGSADEEEVPPPQKPLRPMTAAHTTDAVLLEGVRFRRVTEGTRLVFLGGASSVNITLREPAIARWKRMLELQADRAGWDTAAATQRMRADALAGAAVQRARQ